MEQSALAPEASPLPSSPSVLIIEPFYGGSHRHLIDYLTEVVLPPGSYHLVAMTAKKWHWRARCSALHVSQEVAKALDGRQFSHLFCSSVLSLAELIGLCPGLAACRKLVYFHENQLVYPVRKSHGERDFQYGYNQILTALAADLVLFNSEHNRDSFVGGLNSFLNAMPDYRTRGLGPRIAAKSRILHLPVAAAPAALAVPAVAPDQQQEQQQQQEPLRILWPHRWEHDKNPEAFFAALYELADSGLDFLVCVLGQSFAGPPLPAFDEAQERLGAAGRIAHWGFVEDRRAYLDLIAGCHVVVSTAVHEFFGLAMLEATTAGCYPVAPRRLSYPELLPPECLYTTDRQLVKLLRRLCRGGPRLARRLRADADAFRLERLRPDALRPDYAELFSANQLEAST